MTTPDRHPRENDDKETTVFPLEDQPATGATYAGPTVATAPSGFAGAGTATDWDRIPAYGYGVDPEAVAGSTAVPARRERSGSPVLAVAGVVSLAVATWVIVGTPSLSSTVLLAAGLILAVLVGLSLVLRK